jgi:hypothetical protein
MVEQTTGKNNQILKEDPLRREDKERSALDEGICPLLAFHPINPTLSLC